MKNLQIPTRCVLVALAVTVFTLNGLCSVSLGDDVKVFLLAGHSNIGGTARVENLEPAWNVPQDDVWIWTDHNVDSIGDWVTLEPGHGNVTHSTRPDDPEGITAPGDGRLRLGPELSLGRTLADAYPEDRIALIKQVRSETITAWSPTNVGPPDDPNHPWSSLVQKSSDAFEALDAAGHSYEVEGFFFGLGGRDARNWALPGSSDPVEIAAGEEAALARGEAYGEHLTSLISAARDEFSVELPFVMNLMVPETTPELATAYPGFLRVREGQLAVADKVPLVAGFETEGLTLRDAVHYDATGQIEFGHRFAASYLDLVTPDLPDFDLDGTVGFGDFLILSTNFSQPGSFEDGDTNFDGFIDFEDFLRLSTTFGQTVSPSATASVPEPALECWLGVALLLMVRFRQRRHCEPKVAVTS